MAKINLRGVTPVSPTPLGEKFGGESAAGEKIAFNSCYMTIGDRPFFAVSGEIHFYRVSPDQWDDAIAKAKAGGVDIISTYVCWNVHEEVEGTFRFDGCRDLRAFLLRCRAAGMRVILRVGPFVHGEMRNGGLPDWLYGKPFEVRNNSKGYLACVRRFYAAIHAQAQGLYFAQNGPVIGVQIENEYMHSAAPWEMTRGTANEWCPSGQDGEAHILALKQIAQEEGLIAPFYTCTAWGGAITPTQELLPLWGGYAYWPWIFNDGPGEHPCTPEFIYRDNHNDAVASTYNFEPRYRPESMPFACCEMMGGMTCSYNYRFTVPWESVDALANIKLGSGCALLGYYMYRGGTTPKGERTPYLNEGAMPRMSYDYQAPMGEYGQLRPSYFRLRTLHDFCHTFAGRLLRMRTVLPEGADTMRPTDTGALRFAVRTDGQSGFVFINNFQDHLDMPAREDESIELEMDGGTITLSGLSLAGGENAVLPFGLEMDGVRLNWASAQPITHFAVEGAPCWFFFTPEGMTPAFHFSAEGIARIEGCRAQNAGGEWVVLPEAGEMCEFSVFAGGRKIRVICMTRTQSQSFTHARVGGREAAILSDTGVYEREGKLFAERLDGGYRVLAYPADALGEIAGAKPVSCGPFAGYEAEAASPDDLTKELVQVGPSRYVLDIPQAVLSGRKTVLLRIDYVGDIGQAFIDGEMIGDNFANGAPWDLRLDDHAAALKTHPLTLYITPIKENARVDYSAMAAQRELVDGAYAAISRAALHTMDDIALPVK